MPTKVHLVKAMVFPVVMYGCESQTVKKAECQRIDAFELWCWRRLLRVPWTARRSNQFILKEISPGCSLEGLMLKLKLQYFAHLMRRTDSFIGKDPDAGKDWRQEEKEMTEDDMIGWYHQLNWYEFEQAAGDEGGQGSLMCCGPWGCKETDMTEWLNQTEWLKERYMYSKKGEWINLRWVTGLIEVHHTIKKMKISDRIKHTKDIINICSKIHHHGNLHHCICNGQDLATNSNVCRKSNGSMHGHVIIQRNTL